MTKVAKIGARDYDVISVGGRQEVVGEAVAQELRFHYRFLQHVPATRNMGPLNP